MRKSVVLYGLALLAAETAAINANVMNERVRLAKAWVDQGTQVPPKYFRKWLLLPLFDAEWTPPCIMTCQNPKVLGLTESGLDESE